MRSREDVDEVAVGAGQQARRHLDDGHRAAERRVDGSELETDVAAADDEQRLRHVGQIERAGRIHHARIVDLAASAASPASSRWRGSRARTSACLRRRRPLRAAACAGRRCPRSPGCTAPCGACTSWPVPLGEPLDDVVLELAQLVEIDLRLAELDAPRFRVPRFVDQLGDVQQRLRRNAAAIDADAARVHFRIDERDLRPRSAA